MDDLHILLVEDNSADARLVCEALRQGALLRLLPPPEVQPCARLAEAREWLRHRSWTLVLLDLALPDSSGLETALSLLAEASASALIVLTGLQDENVGIQAVQAGAQDYLVKGELSPGTLARAIRYAVLRKQAEEKIHRANEELEQRVRERTGELEAANRELEAFSYSVSHDLRAPLRVIDGFSRLIQEEHLNELSCEARDYVLCVRQNVQQMNTLIDDLLEFSRCSRQALRVWPCAIKEIALEAWARLGPERSGRTVILRISDELGTCTADPQLLRQVLMNLLSNALKFTRNRPQAFVEIGSASTAHNEDVFFIRDNGVGFEMSLAHKLFGVFQRLHRVQDFPGTGVGLAIVQRIIHRHRGRVWAEGQVNEGATFYFSLPRETGRP